MERGGLPVTLRQRVPHARGWLLPWKPCPSRLLAELHPGVVRRAEPPRSFASRWILTAEGGPKGRGPNPRRALKGTTCPLSRMWNWIGRQPSSCRRGECCAVLCSSHTCVLASRSFQVFSRAALRGAGQNSQDKMGTVLGTDPDRSCHLLPFLGGPRPRRQDLGVFHALLIPESKQFVSLHSALRIKRYIT